MIPKIRLNFFPDTATFTDPAYTSGDPTADPLDPNGGIYGVTPISTSDPAYQAMLAGNSGVGGGSLDVWGNSGWSSMAPSTGGAASNTPAQSSTTGAGILGWLGLANNVAATATGATRRGATTRTGVTSKNTPLSSFGTMTAGTLLVVVALFIGAIYLLRKR